VRSVINRPDATMTDGLDNAVFILGPEARVIDATPGYAAVVIDAERNVRFKGAQSR
jgi:thiamine biosynthesis lipoprotein ApbE